MYGVLPCKVHQKTEEYDFKKTPEFFSLNRMHRINEQRDRHSKDFLQPFEGVNKINRDFAKAYSKKAENYYSKEQLEKL